MKTTDKGAGTMPATAAIMASSRAAMKAWRELFQESTRFISDRLQQDMATQEAMLACKSPAERLQVQAEFCKNAMDQYSGEASKLYEMVSKATESSWRQAGLAFSRGYDDVPL